MGYSDTLRNTGADKQHLLLHQITDACNSALRSQVPPSGLDGHLHSYMKTPIKDTIERMKCALSLAQIQAAALWIPGSFI